MASSFEADIHELLLKNPWKRRFWEGERSSFTESSGNPSIAANSGEGDQF
jgi:hypothetical protein